jgi:hypothetical protein
MTHQCMLSEMILFPAHIEVNPTVQIVFPKLVVAERQGAVVGENIQWQSCCRVRGA